MPLSGTLQSLYLLVGNNLYPPDINNGGQQKHVTHPTLIYWAGNKNTLPAPTLIYWGPATKTRYPPYI
ncbi:MAG: hypothetical protein DRR16_18115 [Candidatus Parabeggiatoa sp. nov. 3]|nr:MAG: hypothetical protein DRR00_07565 [Gammaproteobacteria bacterium]RKZ61912.1 MAG: hypothetical protein DRQ99_19635 [Gammaproteobacteria bacterium]RKZ83105.1 MAG: hypothetical protein DRR16_18115 [Gammaproteobacteria bacterium]